MMDQMKTTAKTIDSDGHDIITRRWTRGRRRLRRWTQINRTYQTIDQIKTTDHTMDQMTMIYQAMNKMKTKDDGPAEYNR